MAKKIKFIGVDKVITNLNKELAKIAGLSMKGLIRSAIIIRRDMDKTPPKIPVDIGNLRASWFVSTGTGNKSQRAVDFKGKKAGEMSTQHSAVVGSTVAKAAGKPWMVIGFSANYAAFVEADHTAKRKRSGSGGGFMESAITRNKPLILEMIRKEANK